jgi:hypothetical protein
MAAVCYAVSLLSIDAEIPPTGINIAKNALVFRRNANSRRFFVIMPNNKTQEGNKPSQGGMQGGGFNDPQTGKHGSGQGVQSEMNEPHRSQFDKTDSSGGQSGSKKQEDEE